VVAFAASEGIGMARRKSVLWDILRSKLWLIICAGATAACLTLAIQLSRDPAFIPLDSARAKLIMALCIIFGVPAGLYGIVATALLSGGASKLRELSTLRLQLVELEQLRIAQRARIDELATLREIAYVVNRESDFSIIAEKSLPLIAELLQPTEAAIFLIDEPGLHPAPFAQYSGGKFLTGRKLAARTIPGFSVDQFERHSIICRVHGEAFHALVPLKVDDEILGVLFLTFPSDGRRDVVQVHDFNNKRRALLQEIAQHISLAVKTKHLRMKSVVDGLTRLYSKSHFGVQLAAQVDLGSRKGEAFSLIICDIDHFKRTNDTYGHSTGDTVLAGVAKTIREALRKYDSGYRTGGEELAVLLPRTDLAGATRIAERLRTRIEGRRFKAEDGSFFRVTISCGVAQYRMAEAPEDMFNRADRRLYQAKENGRNCVVPQAA